MDWIPARMIFRHVRSAVQSERQNTGSGFGQAYAQRRQPEVKEKQLDQQGSRADAFDIGGGNNSDQLAAADAHTAGQCAGYQRAEKSGGR
jgi:hypothetical protein